MRRFRWAILGTALLVAAVFFYPGPFLRPFGRYLVQADRPVHSDCLFVLAGDDYGDRILKAAELFRQGYADRIFVSGPRCCYGHTEDEMAIDFARRKGATDVPFTGLPNQGKSTVSEGIDVLPRLRAAGCGSVLVVTSDFHTRRAGRILRRVWPNLQVRMAAAPAVEYDADRWWTTRNFQKTFFFEWSKTFADWMGL